MSKEINKFDCVVFDLETNGFSGASVLSVSALYAEYMPSTDQLEIKDELNRYYYRSPGESQNPNAIRVNGLTDQKIRLLRAGADYPEQFTDDLPSFEKFCRGCDFFVAHNISFDRQFVPFIAKKKNQFCTMKENTAINPLGRWSKLSITADYYGIKVNDNDLHGSRYDTQLCFEILQAMYKNRHKNLLRLVNQG
jgi:DNA polymerase-3 subunit epsilon